MHAAHVAELVAAVGVGVVIGILISRERKTEKKKKVVERIKLAVDAKPIMRSQLPSKTVEEKLDYSKADPALWAYQELVFSGSSVAIKHPKKEKREGVITEGIQTFKDNPGKYFAIQYQSNMLEWPEDQQTYTLLLRDGMKGYKPQNCGPDGWMTIIMAEYQRLPPLKELNFEALCDPFTDTMVYEGYTLHHEKNRPISPGRCMGVGDIPSLKIIGDIDPSDVIQGGVGDCWLLSAIASLAEFDGAVAHLFRKNEDLDNKPYTSFNMYTLTLWDLEADGGWAEKDVVVDERLATSADGNGLLGCSPSLDVHARWVWLESCCGNNSLEKALAIHCGGWDKIDGGSITHGWRLLTGCQEQYTIVKDTKTGKFKCLGTFNPNTGEWEQLTNSPHGGFRGLWPMKWPELGREDGEDGLFVQLDEEQLFHRMCAWDDENYILGAGTKAGSDKNNTDGIVDGHAYSVIACHSDVAGTHHDLLQMRNPHGKGEFQIGQWDDDGPGWDEFPEVREALQPTAADDGIFYMSKEEFFQYFQTLYVCAKSMSEFKTD